MDTESICYLKHRIEQARLAADNASSFAVAKAHRVMQHRYELAHDEALAGGDIPAPPSGTRASRSRLM
jgi:hypothetical protein